MCITTHIDTYVYKYVYKPALVQTVLKAKITETHNIKNDWNSNTTKTKLILS